MSLPIRYAAFLVVTLLAEACAPECPVRVPCRFRAVKAPVPRPEASQQVRPLPPLPRPPLLEDESGAAGAPRDETAFEFDVEEQDAFEVDVPPLLDGVRHSFRKRSNRDLFYRVMGTFFEKYLLGSPDGESMTAPKISLVPN